MAVLQSIDDAREERVGRDGVTAAAYTDALARSADALAWIRARHADGKLPLLRLPGGPTILPA
jgi:glucose-6-phosphate isomerase